MDTNQPELKMETSNTRNKPTAEVWPSKARRGSPAKVSQQIPNTPENKVVKHIKPELDCQNPRKNTYPTPLFSLFPPLTQNEDIFVDEDPESNKSWKQAYRHAMYLMERQKTRYLTSRKGKEKAVLCKDCQTKGEKTLQIACQNRSKQVKNNPYDNMFLIERRVMKESERRLFDSTAIPTNSYLSRKYGVKTRSEGGYVKPNKPIVTKAPVLSKISFDKLQPWLTEDKTNPRVKTSPYPGGLSSMYLPHHC